MELYHKLFLMLAIITVFFYFHLQRPFSMNLSRYEIVSRGGAGRITLVALGDSLTEGMYNRERGASSFHPYSIKLARLLSKLDGGDKVMVLNSGISGERLPSMKERLKMLLHNNRTVLQHGLVLILGGTNDYIDVFRRKKLVEWDKAMLKGDAIINNVREMHDLCHRSDVTSALLTIPMVKSMVGGGVVEELRWEINAALRSYARAHQQNTILIDFAIYVDDLDASNDTQQIWADGLHFTPFGYDQMGQFIYTAIEGFVKSRF